MTELLSPARFAELARAGKADGQHVGITARADGMLSGRSVRFVLSDSSVDRYGDTVSVNGWDLADYRRNAVVLWSHQSGEPPIGRMTSISVEAGKLVGTVEFADAATYDFADLIYRLVKDDYLNAGSVGFLPVRWSFNEKRGGIDFTEQQLLEFSICAVPANANALVQARAKGLITDRFAPRLIERTSTTPRLDAARRALDGMRPPMAALEEARAGLRALR